MEKKLNTLITEINLEHDCDILSTLYRKFPISDYEKEIRNNILFLCPSWMRGYDEDKIYDVVAINPIMNELVKYLSNWNNLNGIYVIRRNSESISCNKLCSVMKL